MRVDGPVEVEIDQDVGGVVDRLPDGVLADAEPGTGPRNLGPLAAGRAVRGVLAR